MGNEGPRVSGTRPTCETKRQDVSTSVLPILFSQTNNMGMVVCQSVGPSLRSSFHGSQMVNPSDFVDFASSATTRLTLIYYLCHEI